MKHKLLMMSLIGIFAIGGLVSCDNGNSIDIGILQLVSATPLNKVAESFESTIENSEFAKTHKINFTLRNPEADEATMSTMATNLVSNSDMVLGIATSASQSLKKASKSLDKNIPVLFSAVTDPVDANLVTSTTSANGTNVSGVSDMGDPKKSMELIDTHFSSTLTSKKVAFIYNSGESNSIQQVSLAKAKMNDLGWSVVDKSVAMETEIETTLNNLGSDVKMLYYPTDNMCAKYKASIAKVAKEKNLFVCCGDSSLVSTGGALFSLGVDYSSLGVQVGEMALKILSGENKIEDTVVGFASKLPLVVNPSLAASWGVTLPESLVAAADEVVEVVSE